MATSEHRNVGDEARKREMELSFFFPLFLSKRRNIFEGNGISVERRYIQGGRGGVGDDLSELEI